MRNDNFDLYFKIADDYLSYGYAMSKYYQDRLELFCQDNGVDIHQLISLFWFKRLFRFIKTSNRRSLKESNDFSKWSSIYNDFKLSGLSKINFFSQNKCNLGVCENIFYDLMKAIEFKLAYDEYKSTQGIESATLTATSEEDCGEELVKVVNIQENTIALENSTSINVASIAPRRLTTPSCNTSVLGTEIRVTANGHCISFNSVTPERSVALVLKALSAS